MSALGNGSDGLAAYLMDYVFALWFLTMQHTAACRDQLVVVRPQGDRTLLSIVHLSNEMQRRSVGRGPSMQKRQLKCCCLLKFPCVLVKISRLTGATLGAAGTSSARECAGFSSCAAVFSGAFGGISEGENKSFSSDGLLNT